MNRTKIFFLYHAVLPSQTCRIPDETKKILGPKLRKLTPQVSKPWNFSVKDQMIWHAKKWKVNVCGCFIHLTICWILLFLIWQSELRGQHCMRYYRKQIAFYSWKRPISVVVVVVLNTLWNSYLNQATKSVYIYLCLPTFPIFKEIPWWKFSKQKRNPFISVPSTLPSTSSLRLRPGLGSNVIVCAVLISVADQCRLSNK